MMNIFLYLSFYSYFTYAMHTLNLKSIEGESSYSCFEKDSPPVDANEIFEDQCVDKHGNKYPSDAVLTSCCHCIMYTCTFSNSYQNRKLAAWKTTISDQCCIHCNGTVFKPDSLIDTVTKDDDCSTIETSYCRIIPNTDKATIEKEYKYKKCCIDNKGDIQKQLLNMVCTTSQQHLNNNPTTLVLHNMVKFT